MNMDVIENRVHDGTFIAVLNFGKSLKLALVQDVVITRMESVATGKVKNIKSVLIISIIDGEITSMNAIETKNGFKTDGMYFFIDDINANNFTSLRRYYPAAKTEQIADQLEIGTIYKCADSIFQIIDKKGPYLYEVVAVEDNHLRLININTQSLRMRIFNKTTNQLS